MKEPRDFPKGLASKYVFNSVFLTWNLPALAAVTICEVVVFTLCGAIMYHYVGNQYITAPAFGSLTPTFKKIAFSFAIPTIVYLGSLYSVRPTLTDSGTRLTSLAVCNSALRVLQNLCKIGAPLQQYAEGLVCVEWHHCHYMGARVHNRRNHSVFQRYAVTYELAVR